MKKLVLPALIALVVVAGAAALFYGSTVGAAPAGDRRSEPAPIDGLEIAVLESSPVQYAARIRAGLPSGCAQAAGHQMRRDGDIVTITVANSMPRGNVACTMIYGTYDLSVTLGSEFRAGTAYSVRVNDKSTAFTAR